MNIYETNADQFNSRLVANIAPRDECQMNAFTGPLCGEFSGHRWIPLIKASDVELLYSLWSVPCINGWVNNREAGDLRRHRAHYGVIVMLRNGPLARYGKLRTRMRRGMPGTFSPPPATSDPDMHHGMCVTHVPWCMPGSLTSVFHWSRWRGKTFPAFPAHAQPAILRIC